MKTRTFVFAAAGLAISLTAAACGPAAPDPTTSGPARSSATSTVAPTTTVAAASHSTTTVPVKDTSSVDGATISPYTWARSSSAALRIGGGATSTLASLLAPASSGGGWLIAGTRTAADGHTTATAWTSPDAITWTTSSLPGGGPYGEARAATDWNGRTVIVGSVGQGSDQRAAVWISPVPGAPFHQVTDTPIFEVPASAASDPTAGGALPTGDAGASDPAPVAGAVMDAVTSGALGLFAEGSMNGRLAFWYSTNGTTWTLLPKAEGAVGGSPDATVRQLLETSSGVFAIGSTQQGGATTAALWSSGDGITWNQVSSPAAFSGDGEHVLTAMAPFGGSLVAVGGTRAATSWSPASWISPNGYNWAPPTESFPEAGGIQTDSAGTVVTDLSASADGTELAAVGGNAAEQRLWTSTDGINWSEVALPANAANDPDWSATEVATNGTSTVVVDSDPGQPRVLVDTSTGWQEVSANPATFGAVQTVATPVRLIRDGEHLVLAATVDRPGQTLGQEQTSTEFLTSTNGTRWRRASTFGGETVTDMTATSRSLVAVGGPSAPAVAVSTTPTDASSPAIPPAMIWTSPNSAPMATDWTTSLLGSVSSVGTSTSAVTRSSAPGTDTAVPQVEAVTASGASGRAGVLAAGQDLGGSGILWTAKDSIGTTTGSTTASSTTAGSTTAGSTTTGSTTASSTTAGSTTTSSTTTGSTTTGSRFGAESASSPASTLDRLPTATNESVTGACQSTSGAVVVGQETDGAGGTAGLIWFRTGTHLTQRASMLPAPPATSEETVDGCADAGAHLLAWGQTATSKGTPEGAVWVSTSAAKNWTLSDSGALSAGNGTGAITDLAQRDGTWLAVAGSAAPSWTAANLRGLAVWRSVNDGKTWQRITTNTPAFESSFGVSASQVAFVGSTPVLAGQVDGRLAVWTGSPAGT